MTERLLLLGLACVGFALSGLATVLTGPSFLGALTALASLAGLVLAARLMVTLHRARRFAALARPTAPRYPLRAIDQTDYAAVLLSDRGHMKLFEITRNGSHAKCRRCQRMAALVTMQHPIWDGPFDEAGSGRVDERQFWWCTWCDGPPPRADGPAVRLPYLDDLPIRLLPELYARAAFQTLPVPVECYVPPPPAPAEAAAPDKETPQ